MIEIVSLIENISHSKELHAEHGLSLFVKQKDKRILIDTGETKKFIKNAKALGVDLLAIDAVVITHNHLDHIGGLAPLLDYNKNVKVYIKKDAKSKFYYKALWFKKYIGEKDNLFETHKERIVFFEDELELSDSIKLGSNKMKNQYYSCKDKSLLEKKESKFVPDTFEHESFLVIEESKGLIIISGCSHNGIINIVNTVKEKYQRPILSVVGGFHLMGFGLRKTNCTKAYIKEISSILDSTCTGKIYTGHCTGEKAFKIMRETIGDKIEYLDTGKRIVI